ncbi:unnamed protein product, partial [marine sediment metagenome]
GKVKPRHGQSSIDAAVEAGILQQSECQRLQALEAARRLVIDVDAFDPQTLLPTKGQVR